MREQRKHIFPDTMLLSQQSELTDVSMIEAVRQTNPGFKTHSPSYAENCQRCVSAYEVRRRGYDVIAKPRPLDGADMLPYMYDRLGWPAVYQNYKLESCAAGTREQAMKKVEEKMKAYGPGSRAIVKVNWILCSKGHVFVAENLNNVIRFADPQTGSLDASWYFRYIDPSCVVLLRTDELEFTSLVEACCK